MDRQPVLEGERLLLRPLRQSDWEALYAVGGDREVWAQHPVSNRWKEPVFRAFFQEALEQGGALAAIDRKAGAIVGSSRFGPLDPAVPEVEIGWTFLARTLWGSGANREMKRLMIDHALQSVQRVVFRVGDTNIRSRRAMEKIGARLTDRTEELEGPAGPIVHLVYEMSREDFAAGPLAA